jgi:serine/threonine protein kinase
MEHFLKSRYRIDNQISENPFSITYKGFVIANNKPVVIKIYKRGTLDSRLIKGMKQKVKELSSINHHGVVKILDGDYGWQGFYYVREYIEGKSLEQILKNSQELGLEKSLAVAEEVCRLLEIVHAKGIIHGALKPGNIFIDPQGIVKVSDFIVEGEIKDAMPQKALSLIYDGKYTSPEELAGQPASISSDIYALGIILCEMLLKRTNFENGLKGSLKKLRGESFLSLEGLAPLPRYMQDIISKTLQKNPLKRFASMGQLRESLEKKSLAAEQPLQEDFVTIFENTVSNYGEEETYKESKFVQDLGKGDVRWSIEKHRTWILSFILVLSLLSGLIYAFLFGR